METSLTEQKAGEHRAVVVVPIYTLTLSEMEQRTLRRALRVLSRHDVVVVKPQSLDVSSLGSLLGVDQRWTVESFADSYFAGREGYNRLMMSEEFYERFLALDYMLVVQTDVLVFSDQLDEWRSRGYDYVGAPWLPAVQTVKGFHPLHRAVWHVRKALSHVTPGFHAVSLKYSVGNGGFSLRRVAKFHAIASTHRDAIAEIIASERGVGGFEDVFWSVKARQLDDTFTVAPWREALLFSVESHPDLAMHYTGGELPFGSHAFARRRNSREWRHWIDIDSLLEG